ncbi:MAG: restriction endonuclease [Caulobacteraceae bacterium]|nr:restriction endonuclease [Caulobacteraceae bacterium]
MKAFQDLCADLVRVHWQVEVEVYSPTRDQGVDGIITSSFQTKLNGTFDGTVIQAKHSAQLGKRLSESLINPELPKIAEMAEAGVRRYILISSMPVSREVAQAIKAKIAALGVTAEIYGGEWVSQIIRQTPKLRALVPRIYGLGDLSWIVDERRLEQTHDLLSMQHELALYVTTDAHRRAVNVLIDHGFVLLLGPASGKSSIASVLAAMALDLNAQSVFRLYGPQDLLTIESARKRSLLLGR